MFTHKDSPILARLIVLLAVALLMAAAPLFFIGGPDWVSSALVKSAWNFGHIIFFALLLWVVQRFIPLLHWRQWCAVLLGALVVSALIELAQQHIGRHASWGDIFNNMAGVLLGLCWGQPLASPNQTWLRIGRVLGVLCIAPACWAVADSAWAQWQLRSSFPQLNSFETRAEWQQLRAEPARVHRVQNPQWVSHGRYALALKLAAGGYSGMRLRVCYGDWQRHAEFKMDVFNPAATPLQLALRLSDTQHDRGKNRYDDRFNHRLLLMPGWNRLSFLTEDIARSPKGRSMDMNALCQMGIFASGLPESQTIYVDNIRLEKAVD